MIIFLLSSFINSSHAEIPKVAIEPYGFIQLDAIYDSSNAKVGDYVTSIPSPRNQSNANQFSMTANQSRLGLNLSVPEAKTLTVTGNFEIDFFNPEVLVDNKATPMLRHAFIKLDWKDKDFNILAGQTWDLFAPLNPNTLNDTVQWTAGNPGYRHPQIRFTKGILLGTSKIEFSGAIARVISDDGLSPAISDADSQMPEFLGRIAFSTPILGIKPTQIGISGTWSRPKYYTVNSGTPDFTQAPTLYTSSGIAVDLTLPCTSVLTLTGELYHGQDMRQLLGLASVNTLTGLAVQESGGWAQFNLSLNDQWGMSLGYSDAWVNHAEDLQNATDAKDNGALYSNVLYHLTSNLTVGEEFSQWHTSYKGLAGGHDTRLQTSVQFIF